MQPHTGSHLFWLRSLWLRWWHYGFNSKPSDVVRFCDDNRVYDNRDAYPEEIKTPMAVSGQLIESALAHREQCKKVRHHKAVLEAGLSNSIVVHGLFTAETVESSFSAGSTVALEFKQ